MHFFCVVLLVLIQILITSWLFIIIHSPPIKTKLKCFFSSLVFHNPPPFFKKIKSRLLGKQKKKKKKKAILPKRFNRDRPFR
ncbi:hypothetical protein RIF29_39979 [Crotalaria pallida]|uniref:Uncharacterized protein n=1 Tax=Crotalaria pallida TaxID=3830 RepID=A0AAN9HQ56_CROPI